VDLSGLNAQQRAVVTAPGGALLVLAGAGTGKTRTLVHRVAWLIDQGVPARRILLLTFTRRAATEMLDRAQALVGMDALSVRGGTFHSFAARTLRRFAESIGFPQSFTIADGADADRLFRAALESAGFPLGKGYPRVAALRSLASRIANREEEPDVAYCERFPELEEHSPRFEAALPKYAELKRSAAVMDFDDLLLHLDTLLRTVPRVAEWISRDVQHVLVDEYQDTNPVQARIVAALSKVHGNLMVVGDDAQSIYGFRGATVRNILRFEEAFPKAKVYYLERNYRSTQPILNLANAVLASSEELYDKTLFTDVEGPLPVHLKPYSDDDETEHVVDSVLARAGEGVPLREQAVLYRSAYHAMRLELTLRRRRIPYVKYGGVRFTEAAHVKDVVSLLRMVANPRDRLAWERVLQWFPSIGAKRAAGMAQAVQEHPERVLVATSYKRSKAYTDLEQLSAAMEGLTAAETAVECVEAAITYAQPYLRQRYDDMHRRLPELEALQGLAVGKERLIDALEELALDPTEQEDTPSDALVLSTVHSAKGLEWSDVHVLSVVGDRFPSARAIEEGAMAEEARLLYVAVTRAKNRLTLYSPRLVHGPRGAFPVDPSQLLEAMPHLDDLVSDPRRPKPRAAAPGRKGKDPAMRDAMSRLDAFLSHHRKR